MAQLNVFALVTLIVVILVLIFLVLTVVYFYRTWHLQPPSIGEAIALFWTGIVFIVLYLALAIYCLWHLFVHTEKVIGDPLPEVEPHHHHHHVHDIPIQVPVPISPPSYVCDPGPSVLNPYPASYPSSYPPPYNYSSIPPPQYEYGSHALQYEPQLAPAPVQVRSATLSSYVPAPITSNVPVLSTSLSNPPVVNSSLSSAPAVVTSQPPPAFSPPVTITSQPPKLIPLQA